MYRNLYIFNIIVIQNQKLQNQEGSKHCNTVFNVDTRTFKMKRAKYQLKSQYTNNSYFYGFTMFQKNLLYFSLFYFELSYDFVFFFFLDIWSQRLTFSRVFRRRNYGRGFSNALLSSHFCMLIGFYATRSRRYTSYYTITVEVTRDPSKVLSPKVLQTGFADRNAVGNAKRARGNARKSFRPTSSSVGTGKRKRSPPNETVAWTGAAHKQYISCTPQCVPHRRDINTSCAS